MRLARRVAVLEGPLPGGRLPDRAHAVVTAVAAAWGVEPAAVARETVAILHAAHAAGALGSFAALEAFVGQAGGGAGAVPPEPAFIRSDRR